MDNNEIKLQWLDVLKNPFTVNGFYWLEKEKVFWRLPKEHIDSFSENISNLARNTSGGNIRFKTNSKNIAIKAKLNSVNHMPHMPRTGHSSFDFYKLEDTATFCGIAMSNYENDLIESIVIKDITEDITEWIIYFPLYNGVESVSIGIDEGSEIYKCSDYKIKKPIVFYGSSITQGGCASRSGNSYSNMISNMMSANTLNFGFSGSALGEELMAEILSEIDASCYVLDYDHNAPNWEHLEKTHEKFFKIIREKHKDTPIIFMTKPNIDLCKKESKKRKEVIFRTYENAKDVGDSNVYFIDGAKLFGSDFRDFCTVDTSHPNDLGFYRMAVVVFDVLKTLELFDKQ